MAIPDFQTIMLPLLELLKDGQERTARQCVEALALHFGLSKEERSELLPSGQQPVFDNRVGWARTYLKKAGLLESPRRGVVRITQRGLEVLKKVPEHINIAFLMQFDEFKEFRKRRPPEEHSKESGEKDFEHDPVEQIERAFDHYQDALAETLLEQVSQLSPSSFERLVVHLLVKMGYGGGLKQASKVVGGSGDEGIDGIINEDKLGLDIIYIQAKQWSSPVGRSEIQKFVGALYGKKGRKGIFITTSTFTKEARDFVKNIEPRVVLIDGETMARLMIEHGVGVTTKAVYELKSVDHDFFEEGA